MQSLIHRNPLLLTLALAAPLASCSATESNPCQEAAQIAADCQDIEQTAPEMECTGEDRAAAESIVEGGCEAVAAGKADGMFCWSWLKWMGLCEFSSAVAAGSDIDPYANTIAEMALDLPGVEMAAPLEGTLAGTFVGTDLSGDSCTIGIRLYSGDSLFGSAVFIEGIRASEEGLEGTEENWPYPGFRFDLSPEESFYLMEYGETDHTITARVKQEIPFGRPDPHSSIYLEAPPTGGAIIEITDHANERSLRCTSPAN